MRTRRDFLSGAAGLALLPYASGAAGAQGTLVNDIHSQLDATRVDRVVAVDSEAALRRAIRSARRDGKGGLDRRRPSCHGRPTVRKRRGPDRHASDATRASP